MLEKRKGWRRIILAGDPIPVLHWLDMEMVTLLCGGGVVRNT
jgi:hypothetical protein